jgi:GTP-binding protein YchF
VNFADVRLDRRFAFNFNNVIAVILKGHASSRIRIMKIALIGLPQVGKKTLFSLMTGVPYDQLTVRAGDYPVGMVKVTDPRVEKLIALYNPKKSKYAEIECTLAPAPPKDTKPRDQWLGKLKDMDAFCHVVRAFEDEAVFHASGTVDPLRDVEVMNLELAITDLSLVELRLERIAQEQKKKPDADRAEEAALLQTLKPYLESGKSLREHPMQEAELKKIRSLQFLTLKSMVTALNCGESNFPNPQLLAAAQTRITGPGNEVCTLSAKLEAEVAQIGNAAERAEFLEALGIDEPAVNVLTRLLYKALGYICFFTVGEDEVRAWTIRRGGTAVDAAHAIHSDLARGFIRAEVMKCDDLLAAGAQRGSGHAAEVHLKETAKLHLKGKDYIVEDGDIVHVRHSG